MTIHTACELYDYLSAKRSPFPGVGAGTTRYLSSACSATVRSAITRAARKYSSRCIRSSSFRTYQWSILLRLTARFDTLVLLTQERVPLLQRCGAASPPPHETPTDRWAPAYAPAPRRWPPRPAWPGGGPPSRRGPRRWRCSDRWPGRPVSSCTIGQGRRHAAGDLKVAPTFLCAPMRHESIDDRKRGP